MLSRNWNKCVLGEWRVCLVSVQNGFLFHSNLPKKLSLTVTANGSMKKSK